jgi:hypothetical protein
MKNQVEHNELEKQKQMEKFKIDSSKLNKN